MKQGREEEGLSRWRVFRAGTAADGACSPVRTLVALSLWPGAFHFNLVLVIACIFVFPARVAVLYVCPSYYIYFILFFICVMISDKYIMLLHMHATQVVGCKIIYMHACVRVQGVMHAVVLHVPSGQCHGQMGLLHREVHMQAWA
jgi:2-acylglycerol O-acyltransferase 2